MTLRCVCYRLLPSRTRVSRKTHTVPADSFRCLLVCCDKMGVYTYDLVASQERKQLIYDMMKEGDWKSVCQEFHVSHLGVVDVMLFFRNKMNTGNRC